MSLSKILIVEDEGIEALDIQQRLNNLGYSVTAVASSGEEAVNLAEIEPPDLVLMDIMLSGELDGVDTAGRILARFDIPIIYLTAYADDKTLLRAKITEPYGYIVKPLRERELHITIDMALYKHTMERKLRESERWLATTLKSIGDAVIATDKNGLITFMNPVAEELTGWKLKEALHVDLTSVFNIINRDTGLAVENPVTNVILRGTVVGLANHTRLISKNGMQIPIDDSAAPIKDERENLIGVVLVFRDVTEREKSELALRESENKFRTIVETANEGIWIVDETRNTKYVNARMAMMVGYKVEEMISKPWHLFMHETEISGTEPGIEPGKDGRSVKESYEYKLRRKDGTPLWVIIHATSHYDCTGRFLGSFSMVTDITERKMTEIELEENDIRLKELIDTKNKFFNILAHDLKNPFTCLIGSSELLFENINELDTEKIKDLAQIVYDTSKYGYGILQNLLDWSRSKTGLLSLNPERINLKNIIDEQVLNMIRISTNKQIEICSLVKKDVFTITDKNVLDAILRNLINNAIKFTNRNGKVFINVLKKKGEYIISIKDNGIGISKENIERIFRLDAKPVPGTEMEQGTGLGLKICKEFVEKLDGNIWVESTENIGSEFIFSIPIKEN